MGEKILLEAFNEEFIESLQKPRYDIEKELIHFLKHIKDVAPKEKRFFENVESRIKGLSSFEEKIKRKKYIDSWDIKSNISNNQDLICDKLTDLIGFRINCFFVIDEKYLYDELKKYYDLKKFSAKVILNFDENTMQKNGHILYKVSGKYDLKYSFELQIKSLMHNLWGEVEHKTIYKNCDYNVNLNSKKIITEEIFNILNASDKQLLTVFSETHDEKQLIQSLFFNQTKLQISSEFSTKILANHYNNFFSIFNDVETYQMIKEFVGKTLLSDEIIIKNYSNDVFSSEILNLCRLVESKYLDYNIELLYGIYSKIMKFKDFSIFKLFMIEYIAKSFHEDIDELDSEDAFGDTEIDVDVENDNIINYLKDYLDKKEAVR